MIFACLTILVTSIFGQKIVEKAEPSRIPWVDGDLPPQSNNSYYFKVVTGEGSTLSDARERAFESLILNLANQQGVQITSKSITELKTESSASDYSESEKTSHVVKIDREGLKTAFYQNDEYWEKVKEKSGTTEYRFWALYSVAKNPSDYNFEKIQFTTQYGAVPVLKSLIVPGWGQMHKLQKRKGVYILSGQLGSLVGLVTAYGFNQMYNDKANETRDIDLRRTYLNSADNSNLAVNVFAVLAAAIYVYNVVDVSSSKGGRRYAGSNSNRLSFYPYYDTNRFSLNFAYRF